MQRFVVMALSVCAFLTLSGGICTAQVESTLNLNSKLQAAGFYVGDSEKLGESLGYALSSASEEGAVPCAGGNCECIYNWATWEPKIKDIVKKHRIENFLVCQPTSMSVDTCDPNDECKGECTKYVKKIWCLMVDLEEKVIETDIKHLGICRKADV